METEPSQNDFESGPRKSCKVDFLQARKTRVPRKREKHREDRKIKWFDSMFSPDASPQATLFIRGPKPTHAVAG
jgi:hypothetical protein